MRISQLGHTPVIQVSARELLGGAEREEHDDEMRVVHVAPTVFGADGLFGGGERYPLELCRSLARGGEVDCELVTFGPRPGVHDEPCGLRVRVLAPVAHFRGHPAHPLAAGLFAALSGADLVHTHQLRSAPSRIAAVAARARGQAVAVTDHGLGGGGWFRALTRLVDRFLTVSAYSSRTLQAPPDKTTVVYGGADHHRFEPRAGQHRVGGLFVGRLTPHKGVDRLLRALPSGVQMTVVGTAGHDARLPERDYAELLHRLAASRSVRFVTAVNDTELQEFYRRAAVFVLPSVELTCYGRRVGISELLGLSVLEAMASGTPVVASRLGGLPEVVRDGETGFLVEPGDVDELGDRIRMLVGNPALAVRMGEAARDLVLERFTWAACARRCVDAYERMLAHPQTGAR